MLFCPALELGLYAKNKTLVPQAAKKRPAMKQRLVDLLCMMKVIPVTWDPTTGSLRSGGVCHNHRLTTGSLYL